MLLVRPKAITDDVLAASNIAASEAVYSSSAVYALGDEVTAPTGADLNFAAGTYSVAGSSYGSLAAVPGYSYTRSGTIAVFDLDGGTDSFSANTPPINSFGYHAYPAAQNNALQSQSLNTGWNVNNVTVAADAATAPNGTATADVVTVTSAATPEIYQSMFMATGVVNTYSVYAKWISGSQYLKLSTPGSSGATFDLINGTVTATSGSALNGAYIYDAGGGWYRCVILFTPSANGICFNLFVANATGSGSAAAGTQIALWQAQSLTTSLVDGGPILVTTTAAAAVGAQTLAVSCPNGSYSAVYTFDDGSTQSIATSISSGTFTLPAYPATLNRARVSRVQLKTPTGAEGHRVYESLSGGTSATVTMTIASPCVVSWTAHGLAANTPVMFTTSDALPTGLTAGTIYYVLSPTTNSFNVSATPGGAAINTSGTQSGTHTATANPNKGKDPATSPDFWLDIGPTNRWAMFDSYNGTATTDPSSIDVTLNLTGRIDSLAALSLDNAVSIRVIVSTVADGTIYDVTYELTSTEGIADWYSWFFNDIERKSNLLLTDLPSYSSPTVRVIITGTGTAPLGCGNLVIGQSKDLGRTLHDGAQVGIIDYSRKDVDAFGNYTIVQRAFSKRGSFKTRIAKAQVDGIQTALSAFRATPAVYSASDEYAATLIFGFFRSFDIEIDYPAESLCSIEIEGLT